MSNLKKKQIKNGRILNKSNFRRVRFYQMMLTMLKQNINCSLRLCLPTEILFDGLAELDDKQNKAKMGILVKIKQCKECGRRVTKLWEKERIEEYHRLQESFL